MERRIFEIEERFRLLVEAVEDYAIYMVDPSGIIVSWNEGAARIKGYSAKEVLGKEFTLFYTKEDRESGHPQYEIDTAIRTGRYEEEGWRVRKDGAKFWANIILTPIRDPSGKVLGLAKVVRDLTQKREAEERLKRAYAELEEKVKERTAELAASEANARALAEALPQKVWACYSDGTFYYWNRRWLEYTGLSESELTANWSSVVHPDDLTSLIENWRQCLSEGGLYEHHARLKRADGSYRWHLIRGIPVRGADGRVERWYGTSTDIESQKRLEDRQTFLSDAGEILNASLDLDKTLQRLADLSIRRWGGWCAVDILQPDGSLRTMALAHSDPSKVKLGRELLKRYFLDPRASLGAAHVVRTGRSEIVTIESEISDLDFVALDAQSLQLLHELGLKSYICVPLMTRGRVLGAITIVSSESELDDFNLSTAEDLARRAAAAVENARLYHDSQRAIRARDEVLAVVSHDLKNPLAAISLNAQMMKRFADKAQPSGEIKAQAERIGHSAKRMEQLIQDILDVTKIEAGTFALEFRDEQVEHLISETVELFEPIVRDKGVALKTEIAPGCCPARCDHRRVLQVFSNLIGNAIRFTPSGGQITLGARSSEKETVFWVSDSGPGIPREDQSKIFDRFWQAQGEEARGSGLGLAISRGIVEAHRGHIWVESEPGKGATFYFNLPR